MDHIPGGALASLRRAGLPILASALLVGCGNLTTENFNLSQSQSGRKIGGIPFTLNEPQFTVTRVPGTDGQPDVYQTKIDYLPDPTQRYVIALTPMITASTDWTVSYDDNGSLSDTNAKVTDQTVPILTSLAKLAGAAAAADTYNEPEPDQLADISGALERNFKDAAPRVFDETSGKLRTATPAEVTELQQDWSQLRQIFDVLAHENRLASFTYRDLEDRVVLETALYLLNPPVLPDLIKIRIHDADLTTRGTAQQIADRFIALDRMTLKAMLADTLKQRGTIYAQLRATLGDDSALNKNKIVMDMLNNAIGALNAPPRELLFDLVDLSQAVWQSRILAEVNAKIMARQLALRAQSMPLTTGTPTGDLESKDAGLAELQRQKAAVLGLLPVYDQLAVLQAISATDAKYKDAQTSLPALSKQLADAESSLSPVKPASKADDPVVATYLQGDGSTVNSDWIVRQLSVHGTDLRPPYVVVLHSSSVPAAAPRDGIAVSPAIPQLVLPPADVPQAAPVPPVREN